MCKPNGDDNDDDDDDDGGGGDMYCCMKCVQYQLLFPTLSSLIEQISEKKVSISGRFVWIADCDVIVS